MQRVEWGRMKEVGQGGQESGGVKDEGGKKNGEQYRRKKEEGIHREKRRMNEEGMQNDEWAQRKKELKDFQSTI